jgi:hypothetical protein
VRPRPEGRLLARTLRLRAVHEENYRGRLVISDAEWLCQC